MQDKTVWSAHFCVHAAKIVQYLKYAP